MKKLSVSLLFLLSLPSTLFAETLSFQDCLEEVRANNPELQALGYSKEAAKYGRKAAQSDFFPTISGTASAQHTDNRGGSNSSRGGVLDSPNRRSNSSHNNTYRAGVSLTQNIFAGFGTEANLDAAKATEIESAANLKTTLAKVSAELKTAFSDLDYWQRYTTLATKIADRRRENLNIVELRYEGGNENRGSYLQAKALADEAAYEKTQATREVEAARTELARVLGRFDSTGLTIKGEVPHSLTPKYNIDQEIDNHPEVIAAKARRLASEARVKSAKSSFYPDINLTAQATISDSDMMHDNEDYAVGIDASIPIFTFGKNKNRLNQAKAELSEAQAQEKVKKQSVESAITSAETSLKAARDKVNVEKNLKSAAAVRAEIGRSKYNIGLLDYENWDIIENDLISRQKSELKSERDLIVAEANFEKAIGQGVL